MKKLNFILVLFLIIAFGYIVLKPTKIVEIPKVVIKTVTHTDTIFKEIVKIKYFPVKDTILINVDTITNDSSILRKLHYKDDVLELNQLWEVKQKEDSLLESNYKVKETVIHTTDSIFITKTNTIIKPKSGAVIGIGAGYNHALGWKGDASMGYQLKSGWIFSVQGSFIKNDLFVGPKIQKTF